MSTDNSPIHVAFSSDSRGAVGLAVAVDSVLRTTSRPVHVWIIEDGINKETQGRLIASWRGLGSLSQVNFLAHDELPIRLPSWWATSAYPLAACYRLQLPLILPATVSRCLYLDIDILVCTDVGALYDQDMRGFPVGMSNNGNMGSEADRKYINSLGLNPEEYGNSGVLLMDLDAWRTGEHSANIIAFAQTQRPDLWFFDQDVLNLYFKDRILELDKKWNLRDAAASPEGIILHFAGKPKPWEMKADEVTLSGLVAWCQAKERNGFRSTEPSTLQRFGRRIDANLARLRRKLRSLV